MRKLFCFLLLCVLASSGSALSMRSQACSFYTTSGDYDQVNFECLDGARTDNDLLLLMQNSGKVPIKIKEVMVNRTPNYGSQTQTIPGCNVEIDKNMDGVGDVFAEVAPGEKFMIKGTGCPFSDGSYYSATISYYPPSGIEGWSTGQLYLPKSTVSVKATSSNTVMIIAILLFLIVVVLIVIAVTRARRSMITLGKP